MAVNPLLVAAGAAAAWLLTRKSGDDAGSGTPSGGGAPSGSGPGAAAIQADLLVINAGIAAGTIRQGLPIKGVLPTIQPANTLQVGLPGASTATIKGIANAVVAINLAAPIGSPNWAGRMSEWPSWPGSAKPWAAYYWKIRDSINYFMDDVLSRMAAVVPAVYDANGVQTGGISVVSVMENPTFSRDGVKVDPFSGFGGYSESQELMQFRVVGIDPASLLKIALAGIYSGIEEVWAYNAAYRKFLSFAIPGGATNVTELDKFTMSEEAFWLYVNGKLLAARIIAGEEWNAGVDLKYGDSGVNLHELGYGWLENWAPSTLGAAGAQALIASSHATGAAMAIAASARMGYSQTWPGDALFTTAINLHTVNWAPVETRMIRDPASGLAVDVVASREQNKVVAYVPT